MKTWVGADGDAALAGRIDTRRSIGFDQRQHAQTGAEALLRVGTVGHHHLAKGSNARAGLRRLLQHSGWRPFAKPAVRGGQMVGHSDMTRPTGRARMARNPLTAMEYLDRLP